MPRTKRKAASSSLKATLKAKLAAPLRKARRYLRPTRTQRAATPVAKSRTTASPKAARPPTKSSKITARPPRLAPSQRAPRKPQRYTTARPTIGAPAMGAAAPSIAPPLTSTSPATRDTSSHQPRTTDGPSLPRRYGTTKLVLLVRDPWWLYAYWEVTPDHAAAVQRAMSPEERAHAQTFLRLYDVTDRGAAVQRAHRYLDIGLTHDVDNWFVDTGEAHRTWVAELGYRTVHGRFFPLVRSNVVTTPRAGPSDEFDEAWMTTDEEYWKLLGVVYGLGFGTSSFEIRQLLERRFREVVSSARGSVGIPVASGTPVTVSPR